MQSGDTLCFPHGFGFVQDTVPGVRRQGGMLHDARCEKCAISPTPSPSKFPRVRVDRFQKAMWGGGKGRGGCALGDAEEGGGTERGRWVGFCRGCRVGMMPRPDESWETRAVRIHEAQLLLSSAYVLVFP